MYNKDDSQSNENRGDATSPVHPLIYCECGEEIESEDECGLVNKICKGCR